MYNLFTSVLLLLFLFFLLLLLLLLLGACQQLFRSITDSLVKGDLDSNVKTSYYHSHKTSDTVRARYAYYTEPRLPTDPLLQKKNWRTLLGGGGALLLLLLPPFMTVGWNEATHHSYVLLGGGGALPPPPTAAVHDSGMERKPSTTHKFVRFRGCTLLVNPC